MDEVIIQRAKKRSISSVSNDRVATIQRSDEYCDLSISLSHHRQDSASAVNLTLVNQNSANDSLNVGITLTNSSILESAASLKISSTNGTPDRRSARINSPNVSESSIFNLENSSEINLFIDERIGEVRSRVKPIKIHVFQGGEFAYQSISFISALGDCLKSGQFKLEVEYITCKLIKEKKWTVSNLINWLLDCDIHFILTHIHQGITQLRWNMTDLYQSLWRLQAHPGFPNGLHLECPMFTQDKFEYLRVLMPVKFANPTMKIKFNATDDFSYLIKEIERFCKENEEMPGCGFVLKNPFETNSIPWFPKTVEQIISTLKLLWAKYFGLIPYCMLQPCMRNRKEYKVVSFNGKAIYVCTPKDIGKSFSKKPHDRLKLFVDTVLDLLRIQCPSAIVTDCIVRVDVFQNIAGNLVVNELESLEAGYETTSSKKNSIVENGMTLLFATELAKNLELLNGAN